MRQVAQDQLLALDFQARECVFRDLKYSHVRQLDFLCLALEWLTFLS